MSTCMYFVGWAWLLSWVAPFLVAAVISRRRLLPSWTGAPARLVEAGFAISGVLLTAEGLGIPGQLRRTPMTATSLCVLVATLWVCRRDWGQLGRAPSGSRPRQPVTLSALATVATVGAIAAVWASRIAEVMRHGITHSDSLVYQLPYSASFVQSGYTTRLHLTSPGQSPSFHPAGTELLNALTMLAFHRDVAVPFVNVGWLALVLLSGWCIGRRAGVAPATMSAVSVGLVVPGISLVAAGTAGSDVAAAGAVLAACAVLVEAREQETWLAALVPAAAFAGLAIGTKLTAVPVVVALTVVVGWWGRRQLLKTAAAWLTPLVLVGGFWYVRNAVRAGSPLPTAHVPFLPHTTASSIERLGFSVAHYLGNWHVIRHDFWPGLHLFFGAPWIAIMLVAVAAPALTVCRAWSSSSFLALGLLCVGGFIGYVVTPTTALGPEGHPFLFTGNLRYLLPPLLVALALLPLVLSRWRRADLLPIGYLVLALVAAATRGVLPGFAADHWVAAIVAVCAVLTVAIGFYVFRVPALRLAFSAFVVVAVLAVGLPAARSYLDHRYAEPATGAAAAFHWANSVHDSRIGYVGFNTEYPLAGADLSNRVRYVGDVGPHESLRVVTTCEEFLRRLGAGDLDYLVVAGPTSTSGLPRAETWVSTSHALRLVVSQPGLRVYAVRGTPDPAECA